MKINTKTVHLGQPPDPTTGAVNPPVYFTSTYKLEGIEKNKGFDYSRAAHPNRQQLETAVAGLENAKYAVCFASGCAASTAALSILKPGDHVLASEDLYGGTYRIFTQIFQKWGLTFTFISSKASPSEIQKALTPATKMIWLETPTNPTLLTYDIAHYAESKKNKEVLILVDNTFATPILQNPLDLGADIVLHSMTKYLGGHSDVLGGALVSSSQDLYEQFKFYQKATGAILGPMDCYLTHRGIKTLAVRMKAHCDNAVHLQQWLSKHPKIKKVYYPDWEKSKQMRAGGAMISFDVNSTADKLDRFFSTLKIITLAESLGGVESLISYPTKMTHAGIPKAQKEKLGITDTLIRLSVGIEDWQDLRDDLDQALKRL